MISLAAACQPGSVIDPADGFSTTSLPISATSSSEDTDLSATVAAPAGLRAAYIAAVQASASDVYRMTRSDAGLRALNPAQAFVSEFTPEGLHVAPQDGRGDWSLSLAPSGYGCAGELVVPGSVEPEGTGNRVEYRRVTAAGAQLVEWYVNGPLGLEQGFTLPSAPPCRGGEERELVIELSLGDELSAALSEDGEAVALRDTAGAVVLRYTDLFVHDAEGRALPAHLAVAEQTFSIRVDAAGATYPLVVDPLIATEEAKLVAGDGAESDQFGFSVAVTGDTAVVGAPFDDNEKGADAGAAYVFVRSDTFLWIQQAKLLAGDGAIDDNLGWSVALAGDTAIVGALNDNNEKGTDAGAAYVFVRSGTVWSQQAKLLAADGAASDVFGHSVAIAENTVIVGAPFDNNIRGFDAGAAYTFVRSDSSWVQEAQLLAGDGAMFDGFGWSVALAGDTAVIGAPVHANAGAAYTFARSGSSWTQQAEFLGEDGDFFGASVALAGNTAVVGSPGDDENGESAGAVYTFVGSDPSWPLQAKLLASDGAPFDNFGDSVAMSGDIAVVGSAFSNVGTGAAYTFVRSGASWSEHAKLLASDGTSNDLFGSSVAVSGDTAVVGAPQDANDNGFNAGAAYVFDPTLKSNGEPCAVNTHCASGFCVDGICCNTACADPCTQGNTCLEGVCEAGAPAPNKTPCNDDDLCTQLDFCQEGICEGKKPKKCKMGFECNPETGCPQ